MPVAEFPGAAAGAMTASTSPPRSPPTAARRASGGWSSAAHERGLAVILDVVYNHLGASGGPGHGGVRPLLHRQVRDAVGQGDQLRRRRLRPGARVGLPERRGLGARLRHRRAAPRRDPRHLRLQPRAHRRRGRPPRARRQPAGLRDRRVRPQRPGRDARPRPRRVGLRRRLGRRLPSRAAHAPHRRARRLLRRLRPRRPAGQGVPPAARPTTATTRRFAAGASARRPRTSRRRASSSSPRTTTRSATAPTATACPPGRARWRRSARCCPRSSRCCSWARSTASWRRFSSSPTTSTRRSPSATREGRRGEFAAFAAFGGEVPDPQDPATFERSKLTRAARPRAGAALPRADRRPAARCPRGTPAEIEYDELARWLIVRRGPYRARLQLRHRPGDDPLPGRDAGAERRRATRSMRAGSLRTPRHVRSADPMTEVWPGRPFPLGATWDGEGTNFSLFSEHAEARRALPVRRRRRGDADRASTGAPRPQLALLPARRRPRPALRLPRARALRAARGPPLQPRQAADRPVRQGDRGHGRLGRTTPTCCPTSPTRTTTTPTWSPTTTTTPAAIPKSVVIDGSFDWEGDRPPRHAVRRHGHLRDARQGLHDDPSRTSARTCAAPTPGWPPSRRSQYLKDLGVTAVELLPVHHICDESFLHERGLTQLLGLQHDRLPRAPLGVRRHRPPRRAGARVQGHGQGAAPGGHRGDPRRRLQPHRGGQPPRADARRSRASTTPPTTG